MLHPTVVEMRVTVEIEGLGHDTLVMDLDEDECPIALLARFIAAQDRLMGLAVDFLELTQEDVVDAIRICYHPIGIDDGAAGASPDISLVECEPTCGRTPIE